MNCALHFPLSSASLAANRDLKIPEARLGGAYPLRATHCTKGELQR
jgi:hypothetical protein